MCVLSIWRHLLVKGAFFKILNLIRINQISKPFHFNADKSEMYRWACEIDLSGNRLKTRGITPLASINCHGVSDLSVLL